MNEIPIVNVPPVIFTKDVDWLQNTHEPSLEPGRINLLPPDAVLYVPEQIITQQAPMAPINLEDEKNV